MNLGKTSSVRQPCSGSIFASSVGMGRQRQRVAQSCATAPCHVAPTVAGCPNVEHVYDAVHCCASGLVM
eukprot:221494-Amphidinium_carterae.1